jgi:catechol 2,3-dioxygenase-like lactoylglutathione lyase family enzyme
MDKASKLFTNTDRGTISRRTLLQTLGGAAVAAPLAAVFGLGSASSAFGQGRCMRGYGTPACPLDETQATAAIPPVFEPTGWHTVSLDHIAFEVADYRSEAAFYIALMGWKLRSDDGKQAVLDMGDWGTAIFKQGAPAATAPPADAGGRGGARAPSNASVTSFCFDIAPWNAKTMEAELRKRGLTPTADNDGKGFESFHFKDLDGFHVQISNGQGYTKARKSAPANATLSAPAPFATTGWKTVWLDHLSFGASDYKKTVSFYSNLLGWKPTYDEGSQNEVMIGEVGDAIIRGGNSFDPNFGKTPNGRGGRIDHISFGIQPWDTDGVKAGLEKRGLKATIDTSTGDEIHVAAFKSYHTSTPNGYNLQISYVTHDNRLALPNAVKPKALKG